MFGCGLARPGHGAMLAMHATGNAPAGNSVRSDDIHKIIAGHVKVGLKDMHMRQRWNAHIFLPYVCVYVCVKHIHMHVYHMYVYMHGNLQCAIHGRLICNQAWAAQTASHCGWHAIWRVYCLKSIVGCLSARLAQRNQHTIYGSVLSLHSICVCVCAEHVHTRVYHNGHRLSRQTNRNLSN